jgi:CBS domain containing-hemolysin-like protein
MDELKPSYFVFAALLLVANGFFVAVEFALVSLRRTKIEEMIGEGSRGAVHVKQMLVNLDEYLSSCQVGITLASLALGWIGERTFAALFTELFKWTGLTDVLGRIGIPAETGSLITAHTLAILVAMVALTFLHVVLGEQAPKIFALQIPETIALWVVWPMKLCNRVFYPLVWLVNTSTRKTLKSLGLKPVPAHSRAHSEEELGMILDESKLAGVVSSEERKMLERVFRFHDKNVKEIMVPRPDVMALNIRVNEKEAIKQVFESGYSRVPVYDGSLDKIAGILYVKDLLYTMQHPNLIKVVDLLREVQEIPESYSLSQLLRDFQRRRVHMAIVVDEFGATSGLVTLEDIIEEIVGEIRDEHDHEPEEIVKLPDGTFMVESTTHLDLFADTFPGMEMPDEDFETVGGLVLHLAGRLPREGDSFRFGDLIIRVVKREGRRIRKVLVRRIPPGATQQFMAIRKPSERKDASPESRNDSAEPPTGGVSTTP